MNLAMENTHPLCNEKQGVRYIHLVPYGRHTLFILTQSVQSHQGFKNAYYMPVSGPKFNKDEAPASYN